MQRPIVFITLLFICGIYLGSLTEIPICLTLVICFLLWVICFVCLYLYPRKMFIFPCLSIFLITVSIAYYDCWTDSLPGSLLRVPWGGENVVSIEGRLDHLDRVKLSENALD